MSAANALSSGMASSAAPENRPVEPSMEDILASIRRIIADDQSRHAGAAAQPAQPQPARAPPLPAPAAATASPPPIRREPTLTRPVLPPQRPLSRPPAESRPTSTLLAGVAPHINPPPISSTADHAVIDEIASVGVAAALRNGSGREPVARLAEVAPVSAHTLVDDVASMVETRAAVQPPPAVTEPIEPPAVEPPPVTLHNEPAPDPVAFFSPEPVPEPLVSAQARATIETSFHALSASILMQNAGMVEGLARDMLRPMLKSWLDDNLPGIVERLVRQEIERVARGGRA